MAIEFLLVTFPEQRSVLADGAGVGFTNHILMLPRDEYEITLDGSGYNPPSRVIALAGTSIDRPLAIEFARAISVAKAARRLPASDTAERGAPAAAMTKSGRSSTRRVAKKSAKVGAKKSVKVGAKKSVRIGAKKSAKIGAKTSAANAKTAKVKPGRKAKTNA